VKLATKLIIRLW